MALALTAIVFGLQSAIDWTWFIPGPTAMALVAAGFVAGRGPLTAARQGETAELRDAPVERSEMRLVAAAAVMVAALLAAWAIWLPEAADRATGDALTLLDQRDY